MLWRCGAQPRSRRPLTPFFLRHECNTILASIRALWVPGCRECVYKSFNHALLESKISGTISFAQWWVLDLTLETLCCPPQVPEGSAGPCVSQRASYIVHVSMHSLASTQRKA